MSIARKLQKISTNSSTVHNSEYSSKVHIYVHSLASINRRLHGLPSRIRRRLYSQHDCSAGVETNLCDRTTSTSSAYLYPETKTAVKEMTYVIMTLKTSAIYDLRVTWCSSCLNKRCHFIFDYSSYVSWSIFIILYHWKQERIFFEINYKTCNVTVKCVLAIW